MPRRDTRDLQERNGWWHFSKRIPNTKIYTRKSLKTKNLKEAQAKRDALLIDLKEVLAKGEKAKGVIALRKAYTNAVSEDERDYLEEEIIDAAENKAVELGVMAAFKLKPVEELSGDELIPMEFYKSATGSLNVLEYFVGDWLETIERKRSRCDYKRAVEVLMKHFKAAEEVEWDKAERFLNNIGEREGVGQATVMKWKSAYIHLWKYLGIKTDVWRDHFSIPKSKKTSKVAWTGKEVLSFYDSLKKKNDLTSRWLADVIWIAAHTGARAGAIAQLEYNSEDQTIFFPALKFEEKARIIPAHPDIRASLEFWMKNRKSKYTISNSFSKFKTRLGYGFERDFHSLRRTFTTQMENLGIPESVTADIVAHKKKTMTYGLYSDGTSIDVMRRHLFKLDYRKAAQ
jgi:integrase